MVHAHAEYVAAGGNRHPAAADWDIETGLLAYGSDSNVALWKPVVSAIDIYSGAILKPGEGPTTEWSLCTLKWSHR